MAKLVSDAFEVPKEIRTPDFLIQLLGPEHTKLDYDAVMSSIDIIKQTRGGDWPDPSMTYEQDHVDLVWHEEEHRNRTSFSYTVLSPDASECLGCFYFYPPGFRNVSSANADVDVSFWVTQNAYDAGKYEKLYAAILDFLKQWPFQNVVFTNTVIPA